MNPDFPSRKELPMKRGSTSAGSAPLTELIANSPLPAQEPTPAEPGMRAVLGFAPHGGRSQLGSMGSDPVPGGAGLPGSDRLFRVADAGGSYPAGDEGLGELVSTLIGDLEGG